jgi:hypothetical protein
MATHALEARQERHPAAAHWELNWLSLAAAPTFALMALLTGVFGRGPQDMFCSAAQGTSPLSGMVLMYMLMSAFHSGPWLKLLSHRRRGALVPRGRLPDRTHLNRSIPLINNDRAGRVSKADEA